MNKSTETASWLAHLWLIGLGVSVVALASVTYASSVLVLGAALFCAVMIRASLSSLTRAYIAYIVLGLVVAPRFTSVPNVNLDRTQVLASLWILAVCLGGVISNRVSPSSRNLPAAVREQTITPAVVIAALGLIAEYVLVARGSFGIAGQYATGDSGGGYLGLLVQIGPPSAAGALLAARDRLGRTAGDLVVPMTLVALQAVALTFSGFRGAAPLYVLAVALCWFRPAASSSRAALGRRVIVGTTLACFVGALFLLGASVRQSAATAVGLSAPDISLERFNESNYLAVADESRDVPAVKDAVSLSNQLRAVVPRFLYPSKGNIDYGHQVSIAVFGAPADTDTSSTVTTFGDAIINFGVAGGFILVAIYLFVVDAIFRRMRRAATVRALSVRVALVTAALNLEEPAVLNLVGILRVCITIVIAQSLVARAFNPLAAHRRGSAAHDRPNSRSQPTTSHTIVSHGSERHDTVGGGSGVARQSDPRTHESK